MQPDFLCGSPHEVHRKKNKPDIHLTDIRSILNLVEISGIEPLTS